MTIGFQWCPHCSQPHDLRAMHCTATGKRLERAFHRSTSSGMSAVMVPNTVLEGRYRVLSSIGRGAIGEVFEALDLVRKRVVAIKVVQKASRRKSLERLEREALLVRGLRHENICIVHDVGRLPNDAPFIVFERLFGETLGRRLRIRRTLGVAEVLDTFGQILAGLGAAHRARIIHRDLKPENVFLVDRPERVSLAKLLDFGLARDMTRAPDSGLTQPGRACGTVKYMSPEQLRGDALDRRSDLFSVGIMLYQSLSGQHPFEGGSLVEVQINILQRGPKPLRIRRPDLPPLLTDLVSWALSRSRDARPSSAEELARGLQSVPRPTP